MFRQESSNPDRLFSTARRATMLSRTADHLTALIVKNGTMAAAWGAISAESIQTHLADDFLRFPEVATALYGGVTAVDMGLRAVARLAASRTQARLEPMLVSLEDEQPELFVEHDGALCDFDKRLIAYQAEVLGISPEAFAD